VDAFFQSSASGVRIFTIAFQLSDIRPVMKSSRFPAAIEESDFFQIDGFGSRPVSVQSEVYTEKISNNVLYLSEL
jgi:hypothetical protein